MAFTYILFSAAINSYYVGSTNDLTDRLKRHNKGRSTFTKRGIPWIVVYQKSYPTKSEAYQAEHSIKSQKSRKYIQKIVWKYLHEQVIPIRIHNNEINTKSLFKHKVRYVTSLLLYTELRLKIDI